MVTGKLRLLNKAILLGILILAIIVLTGKNTIQSSVNPGVALQLFKLDTTKLIDGDLVFRKGRDLVSRLVLTQGESAQFSHVGIVVRHENMVSVVHSLPESEVFPSGGVQEEALSSFVSIDNASDIAVYRFIKEDSEVRKKVRDYVLQQVGKPFDTDFQLSTDYHLYCTELAIKAYAQAGVEFITNQLLIQVMLIDEPVMPPDYLRRSPHLKRIALGDLGL